MENHHFCMGNIQKTMDNHHFFMGNIQKTTEHHRFFMAKSTNQMAIFNSYVNIYQRVQGSFFATFDQRVVTVLHVLQLQS